MSFAWAEVVEQGVRFEPEIPVTFRYVRGTRPAPYMGSRYQQDLEPAGRYMVHNEDPGDLAPGWESGVVSFKRPLVILFNTEGEPRYDEHSWKARLARRYEATGAELSRRILADGWDAVVTVARYRDLLDTREIVDLKPLRNPGPDERLRKLERRWQASGTAEDLSALVAERVRTGVLPGHAVMYAAALAEGQVQPGDLRAGLTTGGRRAREHRTPWTELALKVARILSVDRAQGTYGFGHGHWPDWAVANSRDQGWRMGESWSPPPRPVVRLDMLGDDRPRQAGGAYDDWMGELVYRDRDPAALQALVYLQQNAPYEYQRLVLAPRQWEELAPPDFPSAGIRASAVSFHDVRERQDYLLKYVLAVEKNLIRALLGEPPRPRSQRKNPDARIRELERAAALGDEEARRALARTRQRAGIVSDDLAEAVGQARREMDGIAREFAGHEREGSRGPADPIPRVPYSVSSGRLWSFGDEIVPGSRYGFDRHYRAGLKIGGEFAWPEGVGRSDLSDWKKGSAEQWRIEKQVRTEATKALEPFVARHGGWINTVHGTNYSVIGWVLERPRSNPDVEADLIRNAWGRL